MHFSKLFVKMKSLHYSDVIMSAMVSQITSLTILYSTVYLGVDQREHQCSASLAFVRGIHRWPVNCPHIGTVTLEIHITFGQGVETYHVNILRPRQNGRNFPDDIFKCIFLNENIWISINISRKFVRKDPINNIPSLVKIMAWRRPGDKPLS